MSTILQRLRGMRQLRFWRHRIHRSKESTESLFNRLPEELIELIISNLKDDIKMLTRLSLVSKKLQRIVQPKLWTNVVGYGGQLMVVITRRKELGESIRTLTVKPPSNAWEYSYQSLNSLLVLTRNVKNLKLMGLPTGNPMNFCVISLLCRNLKRLDVRVPAGSTILALYPICGISTLESVCIRRSTGQVRRSDLDKFGRFWTFGRCAVKHLQMNAGLVVEEMVHLQHACTMLYSLSFFYANVEESRVLEGGQNIWSGFTGFHAPWYHLRSFLKRIEIRIESPCESFCIEKLDKQWEESAFSVWPLRQEERNGTWTRLRVLPRRNANMTFDMTRRAMIDARGTRAGTFLAAGVNFFKFGFMCTGTIAEDTRARTMVTIHVKNISRGSKRKLQSLQKICLNSLLQAECMKDRNNP